jgi:sugar phosphate isomerase/epimerase
VNPKTFHIMLSRPFPRLYDGLSFYLHVETREEALAWVERVFEGIKVVIAPPPPPGVIVVGNRDSVKMLDCDRFRKSKRVAGKRVFEQGTPGQFRHPEKDVRDDLLKVFRRLQDIRLEAAATFETYKVIYERHGGRQQDWDHLEEDRNTYALALKWEANVWQEYLKYASKQEFVMPEPKARAA